MAAMLLRLLDPERVERVIAGVAEPDRIAQVPLAATNAAAAKWARPEKASIVVVGDRAKIEEKLMALNLGEIVVLDATPANAAAPLREMQLADGSSRGAR